jgi:DNA helicase-2/ATP-dependent DNA helicase PcrA
MLSNRNWGREDYQKAQTTPRTTPQLHTAIRRETNERTIEYDADFAPSVIGDLRAGMRVKHQKFGKGKILLIETSSAGHQAKIHFDSVGDKILILAFAKLQIIE